MLRHQLPARSPLDGEALLAGLRAAVGGGREREEVGRRLRRKFSAAEVLLTDSGTSALALALRTAARTRKGPAALPAYGCYDLATAAAAAAVDVVLYDVDPGTLGPVPESMWGLADEGVSSLTVAPLFGVPVAMGPVADAARRSGGLLIEDAAQASGASWRGRPVGGDGDLSVVSFGRGKGVTGGGGGALLAVSPEAVRLVAEARTRLREGGRGLLPLLRAGSAWGLGRPALYGLPASVPFLSLGETRYQEPRPPASMPYASAGMLTRTLGMEAEEVRRRRERAEELERVVVRTRDLEPISVPSEGVPGWLRFPFLASTDGARRRVSSGEARRLGVMPAYPSPLSELPPLRERCRNRDAAFPGASRLATSLFTAPTHGAVTEEDLERLSSLLASP